MHLHEYQVKALLQSFSIPTPEVIVCSDEKQVALAIEKMDLKQAVLKAQVHSAQRKKYGGILFANSAEQIFESSKKLFETRFTSHQVKDVPIEKVLIAPMVEIEKEFYISLVIDGKTPCLLAAEQGGSEVETSENIKIPLRFDGKIYNFQLSFLTKALHIPKDLEKSFCEIIKKLCFAFAQIEATLLEINPLALSKQGFFICLDAKCSVDDNALFRHAGIAAYFDPTQLPSMEAQAYKLNLPYVQLEGEIGCLVNGAGMGMAVIDEIIMGGGSVANFLDAGGTTNLESLEKGLGLLVQDPQVKAIFVSVFEGVMDCSLISEALLESIDRYKVTVPMVVYLQGKNSDDAKHILNSSAAKIHVADHLKQAVTLITTLTKQKHGHIN